MLIAFQAKRHECHGEPPGLEFVLRRAHHFDDALHVHEGEPELGGLLATTAERPPELRKPPVAELAARLQVKRARLARRVVADKTRVVVDPRVVAMFLFQSQRGAH